MQTTPSRTAWSVAQRRAAHQILDRPLIFKDPLALRIVGGDWRSKIEEPPRYSAGFRAFMAARSRYAEDALAEAYRNGVRQYIILGAGLDTFAYRNPWTDLKVFEIDHPATQQWKRELLRQSEIPIPKEMAFVAMDFETQQLGDRLYESGFQAEPAFFSWLGVAPYLTREAFDLTIHFIASLPTPSGVVFDYTILPSLMNPAQCEFFEALSARVAKIFEPFRLFFDPEQLAVDLRVAGFTVIDRIGQGSCQLLKATKCDTSDSRRSLAPDARNPPA